MPRCPHTSPPLRSILSQLGCQRVCRGLNTAKHLSSVRPTLTRLFLFPNTPSIRTLALPEDADATHSTRRLSPPPRIALKSRRQIRSTKNQPIRHPWSPIVLSPSCSDSSRPFCPSSFISRAAFGYSTKLPPQPLLCALNFAGNSFRRCIIQRDAPGLKLLHQRLMPLCSSTLNKTIFAGLSGTSAQGFEWTAWNTDEDVRRVLVPPSVAFYLRVLVKMKTRILRLLLLLPTSSIRAKGLSVQSSSTLKDAPPLITRDPSNERSGEGSSSGSYGGEVYYSTQFGESSGDEGSRR